MPNDALRVEPTLDGVMTVSTDLPFTDEVEDNMGWADELPARRSKEQRGTKRRRVCQRSKKL